MLYFFGGCGVFIVCGILGVMDYMLVFCCIFFVGFGKFGVCFVLWFFVVGGEVFILWCGDGVLFVGVIGVCGDLFVFLLLLLLEVDVVFVMLLLGDGLIVYCMVLMYFGDVLFYVFVWMVFVLLIGVFEGMIVECLIIEWDEFVVDSGCFVVICDGEWVVVDLFDVVVVCLVGIYGFGCEFLLWRVCVGEGVDYV